MLDDFPLNRDQGSEFTPEVAACMGTLRVDRQQLRSVAATAPQTSLSCLEDFRAKAYQAGSCPREAGLEPNSLCGTSCVVCTWLPRFQSHATNDLCCAKVFVPRRPSGENGARIKAAVVIISGCGDVASVP